MVEIDFSYLLNNINSHEKLNITTNINFDDEFEQPQDDESTSGLSLSLKILMSIMYMTISVLSISLNGIVIYMILAYKRMKTITNYFIMNLAIGDLLMACLCIPFTFVSDFLLHFWPFGQLMCSIVSYSQAISVFISAYTLVAISIDRYIAIIYPLRPRMTKLDSKIIITIIWLFSLLTTLPIAFLSKLNPQIDYEYQNEPNESTSLNGDDDDDIKYSCTEQWGLITNGTMDEQGKKQKFYYSMTLMILQYGVPLSVLLFTYTKIAIVVWGKRPPGEAEDARDARMAQSKRKMIKMMITCVLAFTLCWLPFNVFVMIGDNYEEIFYSPNIKYIWFSCHWLAMSHACYNPIIYIWMNSRFRNGFKYVLRFMPCFNREQIQLPDFIPQTFTTSIHGTTMRSTTVRRINTNINHQHQHQHRNGHLKGHHLDEHQNNRNHQVETSLIRDKNNQDQDKSTFHVI